MPRKLSASSDPTTLHPTSAGSLLHIVKPWPALATLDTLVSRNLLAITEEHTETVRLHGPFPHFIVCAVRICNARGGGVVHYVDGYAEGPKKNIARRDAVRSMLGCLRQCLENKREWMDDDTDDVICIPAPKPRGEKTGKGGIEPSSSAATVPESPDECANVSTTTTTTTGETQADASQRHDSETSSSPRTTATDDDIVLTPPSSPPPYTYDDPFDKSGFTPEFKQKAALTQQLRKHAREAQMEREMRWEQLSPEQECVWNEVAIGVGEEGMSNQQMGLLFERIWELKVGRRELEVLCQAGFW